ncbi:hypothetical protein [Paenibacillus sp. UMB4589-SE434]|uniref:hypothetical protein n=1 Tax=Paenibacillus sp. UMB4589-SE434 TaxID=3046314 RepID=UPI00254EA75D|nr:hypothetical protein [Paenibacillus sp. UMB4589-SE434]MDK8179425.1 hypothetical protein [Paenibacillus sp. UMB4589-SE434]
MSQHKIYTKIRNEQNETIFLTFRDEKSLDQYLYKNKKSIILYKSNNRPMNKDLIPSSSLYFSLVDYVAGHYAGKRA